MASTGSNAIMDFYHNIVEKHSDPRTTNWFLVGSPMPLIIILVTYNYFCLSAGPRYMKDRKPYDLKLVIQIYNAVQVLMSGYLVYLAIAGGWWTGYNWTCQPVDYSYSPQAMTMAYGCWVYYMCKLIELLDTVFFVLRKKSNQISYLHMYHHTLMPFCAYIGSKYWPGGHGTLLGLINAFIHIIMYSYYFFSSLGPQYQKYLWWKKHLTALQIAQFCILGVHNGQVLFQPNCNYPKVIAFLVSFQSFYFLYLFTKFYYSSYVKTQREAKETRKEQDKQFSKDKAISENNNSQDRKIKSN